jgi:hypothetical protein
MQLFIPIKDIKHMENYPDYIRTEKLMRICAEAIEQVIMDYGPSDNVGFALVTFGMDQPGIGNYISNCSRDDVIEALKETVKRLQKNQDMPPCKGSA